MPIILLSRTVMANACVALRLVLGLTAVAASAFTQPPAGEPAAQLKPAGEPLIPSVNAKEHVDHEGVPLPAEAIARLGSARFRSDVGPAVLVYSPDGKTIVAANRNGKVNFWDAANGKIRHQVQLKSGFRMSVAIRPDGKDIDFLSDGIYYSFNVASGKELHQRALPDKLPSLLPQFSPDGSALALASPDGTVRVVEIATAKEKCRLRFDGTAVTAVAFTPDGSLLAVCPNSASVEFFDAATGVPRFTLQTPLTHVSIIAFSPDGKKALCAQYFVQPAILMDLTTRKEIGRLAMEGPSGGSACAAFSSDSRHVVVGGFFGANVYDAATAKEVSRIRPRFGCLSLACAADGKTLVTGGGISGVISQWDLRTGKMLPASADPVGELDVVRFTDGGKHLLTYAEGYAVYDARTGKLVHRDPAGPAATGVKYAPLSPDGTMLVAYVAPSKGIALFDAKTGKETWRLGEALDGWRGLAFSASSKQVIYADKVAIYIADIANGKVQRQFTDPKGQSRRFYLSPDGSLLASVSQDPVTRDDTSLVLWDFATGRVAHRIGLRRNQVRSLAFSSDSMELAIAEGDRPNARQDDQVRLIDVHTGRVKRAFGMQRGTETLSYSPDRRVLAISDTLGPLRLWEIASGQPRHTFVGHARDVHTLAFSPDASLLAASSYDAPAFVWDVYGKHTTKPHLSAKEFVADQDRLWNELASKDAAQAFQAIRRLVQNPGPAMTLLRVKLEPVKAIAIKQVPQWLRDLGSEDFEARQSALAELEKLGERIEPVLQKAVDGNATLETKRRLETLLAKLDADPDRWRQSRALEAIEQIATPAAVSLLEALSRGDHGARLTNEANSALARIRNR